MNRYRLTDGTLTSDLDVVISQDLHERTQANASTVVAEVSEKVDSHCGHGVDMHPHEVY